MITEAISRIETDQLNYCSISVKTTVYHHFYSDDTNILLVLYFQKCYFFASFQPKYILTYQQNSIAFCQIFSTKIKFIEIDLVVSELFCTHSFRQICANGIPLKSPLHVAYLYYNCCHIFYDKVYRHETPHI